MNSQPEITMPIPPCESCGDSEWTALETTDTHYVLHSGTWVVDEDTFETEPDFTMSCGSCGAEATFGR